MPNIKKGTVLQGDKCLQLFYYLLIVIGKNRFMTFHKALVCSEDKLLQLEFRLGTLTVRLLSVTSLLSNIFSAHIKLKTYHTNCELVGIRTLLEPFV